MNKLIWVLLIICIPLYCRGEGDIIQAGSPDLQVWSLANKPEYPEDNQPTSARIELGKKLFFDTRLSGSGKMSCATCHNPKLGWSDGLPTAIGHENRVLGRATPSIINTAYNSIQMWDGRHRTLEEQVLGPMRSSDEMNTDMTAMFELLKVDKDYQLAFSRAYPNEEINEVTLAKAIAAFERTVISNDSPFDRWVKGDEDAMTRQQVHGFRLFIDENKGNCVVCHKPPNFTDNGFHNVGILPMSAEPDDGRYKVKPIKSMKGAFKTPSLRNIELTAPYFHNGSATSLEEVVEHYVEGGVDKSNLSPNMKALDITTEEQEALVEFMRALTTHEQPFVLSGLP